MALLLMSVIYVIDVLKHLILVIYPILAADLIIIQDKSESVTQQ